MNEAFDAPDLGDPRRARRAKELRKRLAAKPAANIPGAWDDSAEAITAYRLLGDEKVGWPDMMQPHWARTAARMRQQYAVVLCIADTTEIDFNGQDVQGLGRLSLEAQRRMCLHPAHAVVPDREPLGIPDG